MKQAKATATLRDELDAAEALLDEAKDDSTALKLREDVLDELLDGIPSVRAERERLRIAVPGTKTFLLPRDEFEETEIIEIDPENRDDFICSAYSEEGKTAETVAFHVPQLGLISMPRPERFLARSSMSTCSLVVGFSPRRLVLAHVSFSILAQAIAAIKKCREEGCSDIVVVASVGPEQREGNPAEKGLSGPKVPDAETWMRLGADRVLPFEHSFDEKKLLHLGLTKATVSERLVSATGGTYAHPNRFFPERAATLPVLVPFAPETVGEALGNSAILIRDALDGRLTTTLPQTTMDARTTLRAVASAILEPRNGKINRLAALDAISKALPAAGLPIHSVRRLAIERSLRAIDREVENVNDKTKRPQTIRSGE